MKLSSKNHWDDLHNREREAIESVVAASSRPHDGTENKIARITKQLLGPKIVESMSSYDDFVLWEVLFETFLPNLTGCRVLEVGSAPGEFLAKMASRYECVPYGLDYSKPGVEVNQLVFKRNGLNPENVVWGDLFSEEIQQAYQNEFDLVISRGFIEHFDDVRAVIDKHVCLLKSGGHLVITIPNISGMNYIMTKIFSPELLPMHNLEIMDRTKFREAFSSQDLEQLHSGYFGVFNFNLFYSKSNAFYRTVLKTLQKTQPLLNFLFHTVFGKRVIECAPFSPGLIFIGVKR